MEFKFAPEEEEFRRELREFYLNELPSDTRMDHREEMFLTPEQLEFGRGL